MKIKINVKEDHIINGLCSQVTGCAIALAVRDIIPEARVGYWGIAIEIGSSPITNHSMSTEVVVKMRKFDEFYNKGIVGKARLKHLQPFSFVVDVDESKLFPDKLLEEIEQIIKGSNNIELVTV